MTHNNVALHWLISVTLTVLLDVGIDCRRNVIVTSVRRLR